MGEVDPYLVALLFAGDRADAASRIREWLAQGKAVILDRYVYSNVGFQCAKLPAGEERNRLADWILYLEFCHNGLPRPDVSLFLDVPFTFTERKLSELREGDDREYLQGGQDIHEASLALQQAVRSVYLEAAAKHPALRSSIAASCRGDGIPRRVFLLKYVPSWHQYSKPMRKSRAFKLLGQCLPADPCLHVHRVGLHEGHRSVGHRHEGQRVSFHLRDGIPPGGEHGLFDLVVRCPR